MLKGRFDYSYDIKYEMSPVSANLKLIYFAVANRESIERQPELRNTFFIMLHHDHAEILKVVKDFLPFNQVLNQTMPFSERFKIPRENNQFEDYVVLKISIPLTQ